MAIVWGGSFGSLKTTNLVDEGCKLNTGLPVCCGIFNNTTPHQQHLRHNAPLDCVTETVYIPSPFEEMHMQKALYFDKDIKEFGQRKRAIIDYITSARDLNDSYIWMTRVKRHMRGARLAYTKEDETIDTEYLSRFRVTTTCPHQSIQSRTEWIEPLTIHARNPFALLGCVKIKHEDLARRYPNFASFIRAATILNGIYSTDHILLKADHSRHHHHHLRRTSTEKNFFLMLVPLVSNHQCGGLHACTYRGT